MGNIDERHFVMHCRPRLSYHLGHTRILNALHRLLLDGHRITILIIPYDEHEQGNETFRMRLQEDIELTKLFYRSYLKFEPPQLDIISTFELAFDEDDLNFTHSKFISLYQNQAPSVVKLVKLHGRSWASTSVKFVAKCVSAIKRIGPDATICGGKHKIISDGFFAIFSEIGLSIEQRLIEDLLDLKMQRPMDRQDTAHTLVEINDDEDILLYKLSLMEDERDLVIQWLEHFEKMILFDAPSRLTQDIPTVFRTTAEREFALIRYLKNVRKLIPYSRSRSETRLTVRWSGKYSSLISKAKMSQFTELIRRLFASESLTSLSVVREFTEGATSTNVFEIREIKDSGNQSIINVSVVKIGDFLELSKERDAFESFIRPSKTAGFIDIKGFVGPFEGLGAIRYQSAGYFLAGNIGETLKSAEELISTDVQIAVQKQKLNTLLDFLQSHLYQTLWSSCRRIQKTGISTFFNPFLPAEFSIFVNCFSEERQMYCVDDSAAKQSIEKMKLRVTEYHPDINRVRAYTLGNDKKVDLFYDNLSERAIQKFRENAIIEVEAILKSDRRAFFDRKIKEIGISITKTNKYAVMGQEILHPEDMCVDILETEFENVHVGPIHGDLHCGNLLFDGTKFGIIDYGKTHGQGLIVFDLCLLFTDLLLKAVKTGARIDQLVGLSKVWWARLLGISSNLPVQMLFEHRKLHPRIRQFISEDLFFAAATLTLLGIQKFNLSRDQGIIALLMADKCYREFKRL